MAASVSKEEYLKRYMSSSSKTKTKKNKKLIPNATKLIPKSKIVDDDIDLKALQCHDSGDNELETGDDAPVIVGIIDERPNEVQKMEVFTKSNKWRVIGEEDNSWGPNSSPVTSQMQNIQSGSAIHTKIVQEHSLSDQSFRKVRHDSDSDVSPRRRRYDSNSDISPPRKSRDSDRSPPRRRHDSDPSPPRRMKYPSPRRGPDSSPPPHKHDSDPSPPRRKRYSDSSNQRPQDNATSLQSSKRKEYHDSSVPTSVHKSRFQSDSDQSPLRVVHDSDSDQGKHHRRKYKSTDQRHSYGKRDGKSSHSPPRRNKPKSPNSNDTDSDQYLPRDSKRSQRRDMQSLASCLVQSSKIKDSQDSKAGKSFQKSKHDSDSDQSPPRIIYTANNVHKSSLSISEFPHRHQNHTRTDGNRINKRHDSTDSDHSPPRQRSKSHNIKNNNSDQSPSRDYSRSKYVASSLKSLPERKSSQEFSKEDPLLHTSQKWKDKHQIRSSHEEMAKESHHSDSDASPPRKNRKIASPKLLDKTLDGKKAGLQDSKTLKLENEAAREREKLLLETMGDELTGRNAKTILRDRATGQRRDLEKEQRQKMEEDAVKAEREAKYIEWGRGLKQKDMQKSRLEDDLLEMSKPLARYEDDADLDKHLRDQEREGDPMLAFIKKKKKIQKDAKELPKYSGPQPPPNRYNIWPGYRWDGVDRSNGFEKTRFTRQSSKVAAEEEAYKWSTEDM